MNKPSFTEVATLVEALLQCASVRNRNSRDDIVDHLSEALKGTISRREKDKFDVTNIVKRCMEYEDGLATFVEIVKFFEGDSNSMKNVEKIFSRLFDSLGNGSTPSVTGQPESIKENEPSEKPPKTEPKETDPANAPFLKQVFICNNEEDIAVADKLYNDLKKAGVKPWMESADLLAGKQRHIEVPWQIKKCMYFIALLSKNSLSSQGEAQRDLKAGLDVLATLPPDRTFVIPVRLDNCEPVDPVLSAIKPADLFPSYRNGLIDILRAIAPDSAHLYENDSKTRSYHMTLSQKDYGHQSYLLFASNRITFGNPKDRKADIRIWAEGVKPEHGVIENRDGEYFLGKKAGSCEVSGESVSEKKLETNDEILLGKQFKMKAASVSPAGLLLTLEESNAVDGMLRGILMLDQYLDIGPNPTDHIIIPRMSEKIRLEHENGSFYSIADSERTEIQIGEKNNFSGTSIFITRQKVDKHSDQS